MTEDFGFETGSPDENVDQLRSLSAGDIIYSDMRLFYSGRLNNPAWLPVKNDGVFYKENAEQKLKEVMGQKIDF